MDHRFLPMTPDEVADRGWDAVDVVFVTGDAYVDHPSFAMAILGRALEADGFRVAILSQPDWRSCAPWRQFGRPRVAFAVSAGNLDSMLNHYTAARKVRNDDAYTPGGATGRRPDRATAVYCQRAREAFPGVPILAGGVEASLRRVAHYDYWSDKVRRSILLDAKADVLVYGMGEQPLREACRRLAAGESVRALRNLRGVAYRLGASETLGEAEFAREENSARAQDDRGKPSSENDAAGGSTDASDRAAATPAANAAVGAPRGAGATLTLPSFEEVSTDTDAFCRMTRLVHQELNPCCARRLVQYSGREAVVINPPSLPLAQAELDRLHALPYRRLPHPSYGKQSIPAFEVVRNSIQIMRGCFGGCAFCSLGLHQGKTIQSRSRASILREIREVVAAPGASGTISDLGGPTANMFAMHCGRNDRGEDCRRASCLHPNLCENLVADHGPLIALLEEARKQPGVKQVFVASGVRMDLAARSPAYVRQLAEHHTGGLLKVAPEHSDPTVLRQMHKPTIDTFERFAAEFARASRRAGKEQFLVPYFMAGHPGSTLASMIELALYLKASGYRPDKVQDFIPLPMDLATAMYYTGRDPLSGKEIYVARGQRERRLQRALLQFWKPENYDDVRAALEEAGRTDLIGHGPQSLIAAAKPRPIRSSERSSERSRTRGRGTGKPPARLPPKAGYRPHRTSAERKKRSTNE